MRCFLLALSIIILSACTAQTSEPFDLLIRNGVVYDGSGNAPQQIDIGVRGDRIAALLPPGSSAKANTVLDAKGRAVAPGFINVLSWATESLLEDGRGMSDLIQGVTLQIFGEGWSMGPLNETMRQDAQRRQGDIRYPVEWTTLGEYLEHLERRGVSPNIASFIGATTVRIHELGEDAESGPRGDGRGSIGGRQFADLSTGGICRTG